MFTVEDGSPVLGLAPFPVLDLWHVLPVLVDVLVVLDQLVAHHLLQIRAPGA
jgi:hypothetical protein